MSDTTMMIRLTAKDEASAAFQKLKAEASSMGVTMNEVTAKTKAHAGAMGSFKSALHEATSGTHLFHAALSGGAIGFAARELAALADEAVRYHEASGTMTVNVRENISAWKMFGEAAEGAKVALGDVVLTWAGLGARLGKAAAEAIHGAPSPEINAGDTEADFAERASRIDELREKIAELGRDSVRVNSENTGTLLEYFKVMTDNDNRSPLIAKIQAEQVKLNDELKLQLSIDREIISQREKAAAKIHAMHEAFTEGVFDKPGTTTSTMPMMLGTISVTAIANMKKASDEAKARMKADIAETDRQIDAFDAFNDSVSKSGAAIEDKFTSIKEASRSAAQTMQHNFDGAFRQLAHGEAVKFKDFMKNMFADLAAQASSALFSKGLSGLLGSFGGGVAADSGTSAFAGAQTGGGGGVYMGAEGGVFPGGLRFAGAMSGGGVVSSPSLALIGEGSGPEAVVPLKGGAIPVKGMGGKSVNISFTINAIDTQGAADVIARNAGTVKAIIMDALQGDSNFRGAMAGRLS